MGREKAYVSTDVEASGTHPGRYSMLSIGACLVENPGVTFYREIKPISRRYQTAAMRVGCLGLSNLRRYADRPAFNPKWKRFDPKQVLEALVAVRLPRCDAGTPPELEADRS